MDGTETLIDDTDQTTDQQPCHDGGGLLLNLDGYEGPIDMLLDLAQAKT